MDLNQFLQNILNDLRIELKDEFDRNFERKAFFDVSWKKTKLYNNRGSLMARTNNLRNSINAHIEGEKIVFTSSLPYASIQNEGGEITVTAKMKRYFWAKYYDAVGGFTFKKNGEQSANTLNKRLSVEADQWKAMALKKLGSKIKIESRRFIGPHPKILEVTQDVVNDNLKDLNDIIKQKLQA